jgi:hypothetical protein
MMMRPLVEAHLRGVWLHDAASDDQVQRLINGNPKFPTWEDILTKIRLGYPDGLFMHAERNYGKMCGFSHGGCGSVQARLPPTQSLFA